MVPNMVPNMNVLVSREPIYRRQEGNEPIIMLVSNNIAYYDARIAPVRLPPMPAH